MASIQLQTFSAYHKQKKNTYLAAIDQIDLTVDDGDFVVVIGPSGSGKTTLLRAIAGFIERTDGHLFIDDMKYDDIPPQQRNFGYVSQTFDLYRTKTVYENIAFPLRMLKIDPNEIQKRVQDIADELDVAMLLTRKPRHLSIGQQQKVAIARALVKNPRLLLFDEPFSNLDAIKRQEMREYLKHVHEQFSITSIFVTHQKDDAIILADKIAIMNLGSIIYYGSKEDLLMNKDNGKFREYLYGE